MDRNSEVESDFDEIQRNRDRSIAPQNARLRFFDDEIQRNREGSMAAQNAGFRFFDDEMRRVYARLRGEEEMASLLVRGRGADEGLGMRFGGCRGLTLAQLQSLEDRIATRVETRVAASLNTIAVSFEAEMTRAFNTLRTMGMGGERGGYAMVPEAQATTVNPHAASKIARLPDDDGKKIVMLAKPEEEGAKGQLRSKEVAKQTHEEWSFCVFCNASFTSKESFEEHCRNFIHDTLDIGLCSPKKRKATDNDEVEATMKKSKPSMVGGGDVVGCSKPFQGQTSDEQIAAECIVVASQSAESQSKDDKENTYWCQTCCKQMNSRSMMEEHKKGKKHIKLAAAVVYRSVSDGDA